MPLLENEFFIGLPVGKRAGICESAQGSTDNGIVVVIVDSCGHACQVGTCHMFRAVCDEQGTIIYREFIEHPPEY